MKRLNPETNLPFKRGDIRADGRLFCGYKSKVKQNGFYGEDWVNQESFDKKYLKNLEFKKQDYSINFSKYQNRLSAWAKSNRDVKNSNNAKRRAAKLQATPPWLTTHQLQEIDEHYAMAKELEKVFPWPQHVDHIEALQGNDVCGLHVPWNLQILSRKANLEKGNR